MMKGVIAAFLAFLPCVCLASSERAPPPPKALVERATNEIDFDFAAVKVSHVLHVIYGQAMKTPFVLSPEVLLDERLVTFRFSSTEKQLRPFLTSFLDSLGMRVRTHGGVDFVVMKEKEATRESEPEDREVFVYKPRYRSVAYLSSVLRPVFSRGITVNRPVQRAEGGRSMADAPAESAASMVDQNSDTFLFIGSPKEVAMMERLVPQVDTPVGVVTVRAVAYEVAMSNDEGSAFQLALRLLGGRVGIQIGDSGALTNSVRLSSGSIDAVFSALASDSRFKVISSPNLRIRSGEKGRLVVGQKVPVLGAVTYPQGAGQPVQSVDYQSSGVILELHPVVKEASIDIAVMQQISDFVKTTTGVNNSPTLNTREVTSSVSMSDGEVILLGGLTQEKLSSASSGMSFLPDWLRGKSDGRSKTDVLLLLQVSRVGGRADVASSAD